MNRFWPITRYVRMSDPKSFGKQNLVNCVGPWVVKRFRGRSSQKRYLSERLMRRLMISRNIGVVPTHFELQIIRTIVMPRIFHPTLVTKPKYQQLQSLAEHVISLAEVLVFQSDTPQFFWLGDTASVKHSFSDFLLCELTKYSKTHPNSLFGQNTSRVQRIFEQASSGGTLLYSLSDLSPKNIFLLNSGFIHFDLEMSLVAPIDFLFAKTAINLVRDVRQHDGALSAARFLLDHCENHRNVRAVFAFAMLRMLLYRAVFNTGIDVGLALNSLCNGCEITHVLEEIAHA